MVSIDEVRTHDHEGDCWIIIHGKAYDVTEFLDVHPGGKGIILKYAGKDATKLFDVVHPKDIVNHLKPEKHLGDVEGEQVVQDADEVEEEVPLSEEDQERKEMSLLKPDLEQVFNLLDFELVAKETMPKGGWAYYSSAADDEITLRENHLLFQRIFFKPKILVDVSKIDLSTSMLGTNTSLPFYVTATLLGKLGHPDGEKVLTRLCGTSDIIQMIPTLASYSFDEIVDLSIDSQTQWMQLYVNSDREVTRKIVQHAEKRGVKGLFITVDAPALGRREKDMRSKFESSESNVQKLNSNELKKVDRNQGALRAISSFIDTSLNWKDIPWFQSITKMPIILKGVQRWEDLVKALELKVSGIVLSNHGGRQLEFARSLIEVLVEVMPKLRERHLDQGFEVYVDGGVRRGTDIMKLLCLGAKGVGIGRPFLYAMSTYGQEGVEKLFDILRDELEMNMRLIGATKISDLDESFVDSKGILTGRQVPEDYLFSKVYERMYTPQFKSKL